MEIAVAWGDVSSAPVDVGIGSGADGCSRGRRVSAAQTTVDPIHSGRASPLVVSATYRVTRNAIYLGFALLLGGRVQALSSTPDVIVTVAFVLYLNHFRIPPEEAALDVRFGEEFDSYKARVRR